LLSDTSAMLPSKYRQLLASVTAHKLLIATNQGHQGAAFKNHLTVRGTGQ